MSRSEFRWRSSFALHIVISINEEWTTNYEFCSRSPLRQDNCLHLIRIRRKTKRKKFRRTENDRRPTRNDALKTLVHSIQRSAFRWHTCCANSIRYAHDRHITDFTFFCFVASRDLFSVVPCEFADRPCRVIHCIVVTRRSVDDFCLLHALSFVNCLVQNKAINFVHRFFCVNENWNENRHWFTCVRKVKIEFATKEERSN